MSYVLEGVDTLWLRPPMFVLFISCFSWICVPFWTATVGGLCLFLKKDPLFSEHKQPLAKASIELNKRTAIVMPIYNEPPIEVFATVSAIYDEIQKTKWAELFDFYVISDTQGAEPVILELALWKITSSEGRTRLYYRNREKNLNRKAGNIEDFIKRWGALSNFMLVLDADSVMEAQTIIELACLMQANPQAGIIQTSPSLIFAETFFARIIQFTARLYGKLFSHGTAFWNGAASNYWGHNAIIRTEAFRANCGLGKLPGNPPFGGEILSHDFVEAALIRANGWGVYLAAKLQGSYEQLPPNAIEYLKRDKRWSQGNLQHIKLLFWPKLTMASRTFFALGALAYLSSPLWLMLLLVSTLNSLLENLITHEYFHSSYQLFPDWPVSRASDATLLFTVALVILFSPKLASVIYAIKDKQISKSFGEARNLLLSVLIEIIFFTLFAPTMMMFHSKFVIYTLLGKVVAWNPQNRSKMDLSFYDSLRASWWISLIGLAWTAILASIAARELFWMTPILLGLIISPISIWLTSSKKLGERALAARLFLIPEEHEPPIILKEIIKKRGLLTQKISGIDSFDTVLQKTFPNEKLQEMKVNPIFTGN